MVRLTPDAAAPRIGLVSLLKGEHPAGSPKDIGKSHDWVSAQRRAHGLDFASQWDTEAAQWSQAVQKHFDDERRRATDLWPGVRNRDLLAIRLAARHDAEIKAARSLSLTPFEVATLSVQEWGHGLTEEREKRLGVTDDLDSRSAQARRGHVTRALIAEHRTIKEERGL